LLGYQFDEHQNWAISGLGNNAIMQRVHEALTKNTITKDDFVVVQFTDFNRLDIHKVINSLLEKEFKSGLHSLEIKIN